MAVRAHERGQMTVELCVVFPVVIIVAVIAINALLFFGQCAQFDRVARNAVRTLASSPSVKATPALIAARIENDVGASMAAEDVLCTVECVAAGLMRYTVRVTFSPTLFGMGLRDQIWGVSLPKLKHETSLTLDSYSPHKQVSPDG